MRERGLGDKTRLKSQKHIKAATILHTDGIRAGCISTLACALGPSWLPAHLEVRQGMASGQAAFLPWPCPS